MQTFLKIDTDFRCSVVVPDQYILYKRKFVKNKTNNQISHLMYIVQPKAIFFASTNFTAPTSLLSGAFG